MPPQVDLTAIPDAIQEYLRKQNSIFQYRKPGHYWVTDISRCLRRSYYEISRTPPDRSDGDKTIEILWTLQSRKFLHNLTYAYKWRELDMVKEIRLDQIGESVFLHGRLDMYEYKSQTIIDLKTSNAINWQYDKSMIPRSEDILQIQCYASLFSDIIRVSKLVLLYADMKNLLAFGIPLLDRHTWIRERIGRLHNAATQQAMPAAEPSAMCTLCPFKNRRDREATLNMKLTK